MSDLTKMINDDLRRVEETEIRQHFAGSSAPVGNMKHFSTDGRGAIQFAWDPEWPPLEDWPMPGERLRVRSPHGLIIDVVVAPCVPMKSLGSSEDWLFRCREINESGHRLCRLSAILTPETTFEVTVRDRNAFYARLENDANVIDYTET